MPKHFPEEPQRNKPQGKHFSRIPTSHQPEKSTEATSPAPDRKPDADETHVMSPEDFPPGNNSAQDADGVTDDATTPLYPSKTATEPARPIATPNSMRTANDTATMLGTHEVAAVQPDANLYTSPQPSPYLSSRQAAQDPQETKRRHFVLIAIALVVAALVVGGGGAYYIYRSMRPTVQTSNVQFETDKITRGNFYDTIDATSSLSPVQTADVAPEVTGTITKLSIEDGSVVSKGDVLFTMDNPTVTAATSKAKDELERAQSDLEDKNDQLKEATDKLDELEKTLEESSSKVYEILGSTPAESTFNVDTDDDGTPDALDADGDGKADGYDTNGDGIVDMVDTNGDGTPDAFDINGDGKIGSGDVPSSLTDQQKKELTEAEASYQTAQVQLKSAQNAVDAATTASKDAEETVSNLQDAYDRAQAQEKKLTVRAPISGVIHNVSSSLVEGGSVSTTAKLCEVDDVSQFVITVQASETKVRKAEVGQTVNLTFPDLPDLTATGTVQSVATTATEGTNTYAIEVLLDQPDDSLSQGMTTNASIVLEEIDDVLMVPSKAITTSGRDSYLDILLDPVRGIDTQVQVDVVADNGETAVVEADNIQEGNSVVMSKTTTS